MSAAAKASATPGSRAKAEAEAMKALKKLGFPVTEQVSSPDLTKISGCVTKRLATLTTLMQEFESRAVGDGAKKDGAQEESKKETLKLVYKIDMPHMLHVAKSLH